MYWATFNRPIGANYKSKYDSKDGVAINLEVEEGGEYIIISRMKSDSGKNTYTIIGEGGEVKRYSGFGTSTPEDVVKVLGMSEINFQMQHNPYYLLNMTPGERGKVINSYINLSVIDRAIKSIKKVGNDERAEKRFVKGELDATLKSLEQYNHLERCEIQLTNLNKQYDLVKAMVSRLHEVIKTIHDIRGLVKGGEGGVKIVGYKVRLEALINEAKGVEGGWIEAEEIRQAIDEVDELKIKVEGEAKLIRGLKWRLKQGMPDVCPLCGK
uniref:Uncharacterized protein n=1 Tax=viral metagenome TaxID=1070528 RepID=A0A6M3LIR1_9ZZZZ